MKGLFIPEITAEMFRNGCLESIEALMAEGEIYDIDYQQPCEDCISRQAVLDINEHHHGQMPNHVNHEIWNEINALPSVTPKEKTGRWMNAKVGKLFPSNDFKCSECGNILDFDGVNCGRGDANFCPNCGARMVEPQESKKGENNDRSNQETKSGAGCGGDQGI